jgi:hypothetical protein
LKLDVNHPRLSPLLLTTLFMARKKFKQKASPISPGVGLSDGKPSHWYDQSEHARPSLTLVVCFLTFWVSELARLQSLLELAEELIIALKSGLDAPTGRVAGVWARENDKAGLVELLDGSTEGLGELVWFEVSSSSYISSSGRRRVGTRAYLLVLTALQTTSPAFLARISPSSKPTLPTELAIEILNHYFHVNTPSTPLRPSDIVLPHATSLRLVNSSFRAIIDDGNLLVRSITVVTPNDWLRYFSESNGVLVTGEQADERARAVREISLCFSLPDLPLRDGLTADEVGEDPGWPEALVLLAPLRFPKCFESPSNNRRYIDLLPSYKLPQYESTLHELGMDAYGSSGILTSEEMYGRRLRRSLDDVGIKASEHFLSAFFLDVNRDPIPFGSISLLSHRVPLLVELLHGEGDRQSPGVFVDEFDRPYDPFSSLPPDLRPTIYVYSSSAHPSRQPNKSLGSSFQRLTIPDDDASWAAGKLMWKRTFFTNIHLVGYSVGSASRLALRAQLKRVEKGAGEEEKDVLSGWRWLEYDGTLTPVLSSKT